MDIKKLKAEFEQTECFKRLEHVAQYTFFEFGAYIKRTDVPADIEKKCGGLITALIFSWGAWKEAKAVPEGFILVKKTNRIGNPSVDFSQAPRWAKYWLKDGHSKKYWWSSVRPKKDMDLECYVWGGQHYVEEAPAFGFLGTWDKSLTSKRAMFEAQEPANDSR